MDMKKMNMKSIVLFMMGCMLMAVLPVRADLGASVMLRHNGQSTFYQWDEVQKAVDAAVDGDTIYLTEGTFAQFNITKRIMVRGAGPNTNVSGNCIINIPNDKKLVMPVLDALSFSGTVQVNSAGRQLTFRKTKMAILNFLQKTNFEDVKLDRCCIFSIFQIPTNVRSLNCFNTKIRVLQPLDHKTGNLKFTNCNIVYINDTITAHFIRCVLKYAYSTYERPNNMYPYHNCLIGCSLQDCIFAYTHKGSDNGVGLYYGDEPIFDPYCRSIDENLLRYDDDVFNFANNNYISSIDGKRIGCSGGEYPYNLYPDMPTVTKHSVKVDAAKKKLNVTLTLDKK